MKQTSELSSKTKAELITMARRKKIPVTSGMIKDEMIKAIKKGLRKIEAKKKSNTTKAKSCKRNPVSNTTRRTSKTKTSKVSKVKTARKPKSAVRKKSPVKSKTIKTAVKKRSHVEPVEIPSDLPEHYGDHRLVVMVRDPNWAYAYWDLNPTKVRNLLKSVGQTTKKTRWLLRVYSAELQFPEEKGHFFDVDINVQNGNYYLNLSKPGARFIVEIGVMEVSGLFRSTARSNPIILPLDHPSESVALESIFSEDLTNELNVTKPSPSQSQ